MAIRQLVRTIWSLGPPSSYRVVLGAAFVAGLASAGRAEVPEAGLGPVPVAALASAGDGQAVEPGAIERALAHDSVVAHLDRGQRVLVADQILSADSPSRVMINLSTEFLTVVVTSGRVRFATGPAAGAGEALVVALDGNRVQRLPYDAARLAATLSPGARPLLAQDLDTITARQRRGRFWGSYERLRVNARAPGGISTEEARQSYLAEPAIVRQRRASVGLASVADRGRIAANAFLAAYAADDAHAVAALLDPAPFLSRGGTAAVEQGRLQAASTLLSDQRLRAVLASSPAMTMEGGGALLVTAQGRWRLGLVPRDRALFVTGLEPVQ